MKIGLAMMVGALALGGCASSRSGPVEVTRFHLGQPVSPGTAYVETTPGAGLQASAFLPAVKSELARLGYPSSALESSGYTVSVDVSRDTRAALARRSPFSIGIGGGTGGYRSGVGVGASIGLGGGGRREIVVTRMSVQMKRRLGGDVVWEGRAEIETRGRDAGGDAIAGRLARALFRDFPGESGRTISVR